MNLAKNYQTVEKKYFIPQRVEISLELLSFPVGTYCTFLPERWNLAANVLKVKCRKVWGLTLQYAELHLPPQFLAWAWPKV